MVRFSVRLLVAMLAQGLCEKIKRTHYYGLFTVKMTKDGVCYLDDGQLTPCRPWHNVEEKQREAGWEDCTLGRM